VQRRGHLWARTALRAGVVLIAVARESGPVAAGLVSYVVGWILVAIIGVMAGETAVAGRHRLILKKIAAKLLNRT
jgi:hypothetical protein